VTVVSVPAALDRRAEVISRAVRAGKHVLAHKPMALTVADCDEIARLAAEHGVVVVPAHHLRLNAALRSVRGAVRAGRVGLPWNVQADFLVAGGDPVPTGELVNLALYPIDVVHSLLGLAVRSAFRLPLPHLLLEGAGHLRAGGTRAPRPDRRRAS
jgi:predicted dehydrogenase